MRKKKIQAQHRRKSKESEKEESSNERSKKKSKPVQKDNNLFSDSFIVRAANTIRLDG